jgi:hydroxyethylthiazole kinase-like uncharacterized protein yjeF
MTALYSLSEIRAVELAAQASLPRGTLMQRAGSAATDLALRILPQGGLRRVLVLAGPGNNGGDALDMAARLATACDVAIVLFADPGKLPVDAAQALQRARQSDAEFLDAGEARALLAQSWPLVVDGLFGIGLSRTITGNLREMIEALNNSNSIVLALDIPSGLDADTGAVVGEDGIAVVADHTITFIGDKPGLHTCDGRDHAGTVTVAGLDIDASLFPPRRAELSRPELFQQALQPRRHNSHKGSYGDVAVIGGASGMAGATLLAARAAIKCGAGKTHAVFLDDAPALDYEQPELMCRSADGFEIGGSVLVIGPGLGQSGLAQVLLQAALASNTPLVIDADALNLLAAAPSLQKELARRHARPILTPHPLEAARLLGVTSKTVQADRLGSARALAQALQAIVVLKGSGSIIATPEGRIAVNPTGNPGLATAGSGDVLAGICGALLAQRMPTWEAALAAVWLHGSAADLLVERGVGAIGLTAGELIAPVRTLLNRLVQT